MFFFVGFGFAVVDTFDYKQSFEYDTHVLNGSLVVVEVVFERNP